MEEDNKKSSLFKLIWNALMVFIYLGLASLIMFTPRILPYNFRENDSTDDFSIPRIILGIGVAVYAVFRGYRLWKERKI